MKSILRFKHWQLFLLIVILGSWTSPSPLKEIINSISMLTFLIWIYSIGTNGHEKIKSLGLPTFKINLFKINIFLIPVLLTIILTLAPDDPESDITIQTAILIPIGLYLVFALIQPIVFVSKTISTIELRKKIEFSDYFLNIILFFFLIVGVWLLQPKVTRLIGNDEG